MPECVDHSFDHDGTLPCRVDGSPPVAGLKAVPAKVGVIATLDPYPASPGRQLCAVRLDLSATGEAVARAHDLRHRDVQGAEIHVSRVRAAYQDESHESGALLRGDSRGDDRAARVARDNPVPGSIRGGQQAIQSPVERWGLRPAERASLRQFDDMRLNPRGGRGPCQGSVGDWIDQGTGEEDECWHLGGRPRSRCEGPDTVAVFDSDPAIRKDCESRLARGTICDEGPAYENTCAGQADDDPHAANASPELFPIQVGQNPLAIEVLKCDRRTTPRRPQASAYRYGAIKAAASLEVMAGMTSKSTTSLHCEIHSSRSRRSSHSMIW